MEKTSAEDDCVDSGAETGGSDYSPLSSTSSELSMAELQDPFLVSVHLIADPGRARLLQRAADAVLAWLHPELQLFRVSERACASQRPRPRRHQHPGPAQPALALILFLQEASGGGGEEEPLTALHRALQRPPWRHHHTERVSDGRRLLPLPPCSQDFFTLAPGTPLWAVRQVHYGKEIARFTLYCRHENYGDTVRLYKLLLQRRVAQRKDDFCFFVVYSNPDMEVQLSFKRLPRGQVPVPLDSAVMEVRVRDVGALVPLLPQPCSPISEVRWQTEDYDGNKILLQVQAPHIKPGPDPCRPSPAAPDPASAPSTFARSAASNRHRRHQHRAPARPRAQPASYGAGDGPDPQEQWGDGWRAPWGGRRSGSLFSLPNLGSSSSRSTCSSPGPSPVPHHRSCSLTRSSSLVPPFRLNVDALIGAEETDVDTGHRVSAGGAVDLTVVSAYVRSSCRPLSAPPEDIGPTLFPGIPDNAYKAATLGRTANTPAAFLRAHVQGSSDISVNPSDSCSVISATTEEPHKGEEEEVQEFYI